ncbi:Alpha/Beta hydrolase protein [Microdochium bolleyi]|uniref:Palmitoyl-protein thioesterase 1 n=1 Tax=Microdochium bolleyi TaxID=196109 RepID=A0A136IMG9_9PEZI|nr:Alpha/Beta hydrolase protein [Microdochium bolleyi]
MITGLPLSLAQQQQHNSCHRRETTPVMPSATRIQLSLAALAASAIVPALARPSVLQPATSRTARRTPGSWSARNEDGDDTPLPVVIWHGLGDNYAAEGLQSVGDLIQDTNPGTLVYFIRIDDTASSDRSATFYGNVTEQIAKVCDDLASHPILSTAPAIDAVGFSQGGQFLRGYVERCNFPPVRSLVTYGSQHNGIVDYRACSATDWLCRGAMALLHGQTWSDWVQSRLVPAQYFRDPEDLDSYLEHSNFLADINNERVLKNTSYAANLARLENFVMYMFAHDTTVIPKETGWFEEVVGSEVTPLRERAIYKEDWIGLRELDRKGGLRFRTTPGDHMQLSDKSLKEAFTTFFGPADKKFPTEEETEVAEVAEL